MSAKLSQRNPDAKAGLPSARLWQEYRMSLQSQADKVLGNFAQQENVHEASRGEG